ncbi:MAG: prepilin peptidase [Streptosporangiaceae bacterium]
MLVWVVLAGALGLVLGAYVPCLAARARDGVAILRPPPTPLGRAGLGARPADVAPLVAVGVLFAVLTWRLGLGAALPAYLYLTVVGVALAVIDLRTKRLPDPLTLPSYAVALVLLGLAALVTDDGARHFGLALAGMVALYALYALLFLIHPTGVGWGDVKLAGLLGLYLGWLGVDVWAAGTVLGFLLGGLTGIALLASRRATRKTEIPFGPFMIAGALLAVVAGSSLGGWGG